MRKHFKQGEVLKTVNIYVKIGEVYCRISEVRDWIDKTLVGATYCGNTADAEEQSSAETSENSASDETSASASDKTSASATSFNNGGTESLGGGGNIDDMERSFWKRFGEQNADADTNDENSAKSSAKATKSAKAKTSSSAKTSTKASANDNYDDYF